MGTAGTVFPAIQQHGAAAAAASFANYSWVAGTGGPVNYLCKSRSGTIGTRGVISSGDSLGAVIFQGDDGTNFVPGASISTACDGTPGTNDMPGRLMLNTTADGASAATERVRIDSVGNVKIAGTATRATTEGTNHLDIFDGTAPVGTLTNGVSFYSASGEARVMDAGGNSTLLSPHDRETNEWIYHSVDTRTGKGLRVDMERMLRAINQMFGWDFVHEFAATEDNA